MTRSPVGRLVGLVRRGVGDATGDRSTGDDAAAGETSGAFGAGRAALAGGVGGLLGTVGMTVYRLPVFHALPPTAEFWAQYVGGGDAEDHPVAGLLLHLLYGVAAGAAFGPAYAALVERLPGEPDATGMVGGAAYGAALSVFGERVLLEGLLDRELEREHALVFHAGHVVYGLTLGTWLGTRERRGDVYDRQSDGS
ncbi:DUF6789 family protein [Candidatus Halobonum tyrrellensis]|uniref:DUF1440 domain-containing protein n=1 Tax=Candidatus Halobonum tyrrellensis G22 TaxID=1324957 RepID=V4GNC1_9EURY|nr:DUF6789 family protein [Candidatus Halobonum tyrrellensis]ESP86876.1 hypothetical protein K933_16482 [Candidatus Halobonum tyrrellensis G22]